MTETQRDQANTAFTVVLAKLLEELPECLCAVFVDVEGEAVDLAARIGLFDARIAAAEFAIVMGLMRGARWEKHCGFPNEIRLEGHTRSALCRAVCEGYDLLVLLDSPTISAFAAERMEEAALGLREETGLPGSTWMTRLGAQESGLALRSFPPIPAVVEHAGIVRKVADILGFTSDEEGCDVLVRLEDGEELLVGFEQENARWIRTD
ncbi:MAG: hypothetical protein Q8Q09_11720 [Deltaproteobacteria bacterium]|nr:hypothetical protein [Deltaproteobacteria bacterium]